MSAAGSPEKFQLILIKPSHYDDDRYVIQWFRTAIPSNTLAVLHGLALDSQHRRVLGDDVEIIVEAFDECNTHIRPKRTAEVFFNVRVRRAGREVGVRNRPD